MRNNRFNFTSAQTDKELISAVSGKSIKIVEIMISNDAVDGTLTFQEDDATPFGPILYLGQKALVYEHVDWTLQKDKAFNFTSVSLVNHSIWLQWMEV